MTLGQDIFFLVYVSRQCTELEATHKRMLSISNISHSVVRCLDQSFPLLVARKHNYRILPLPPAGSCRPHHGLKRLVAWKLLNGKEHSKNWNGFSEWWRSSKHVSFSIAIRCSYSTLHKEINQTEAHKETQKVWPFSQVVKIDCFIGFAVVHGTPSPWMLSVERRVLYLSSPLWYW